MIFGKLANGLTPHDYQEKAAIQSLKQPSLLQFEPGLGKTLTSLLAGMIYTSRTKRKMVVIAPPSVVGNWYDEADKLVDNIVVFSSGKFPSKLPYNYYLVVDEAHLFQNHDSKRTKKIYSLAEKADRVTLLTATPMRNYPSNLYPLLKMLGHKLGLLSYASYLAKFCQGKISGTANTIELHHEIKDTLISATKERLGLPSLTEKVIPVVFSGKQKIAFDKVFESIKQNYITRKKEAGEFPKHHHLTVLNQLRQATSIIKSMMAIQIAKKAVARGKQVIIFTNYLKSITAMEKMLSKADISYETLTGSVSKANRHKAALRFQDGEASVWLGTIQASGAGINLFKATVVIFVDRTFSPADIEQAVSRAHRQGQKYPVTSIILQDQIVDTWVDSIVSKKYKAIKQIINGITGDIKYMLNNDSLAEIALDNVFG